MYGDTRPVGDAAAVAAVGGPPGARSGLVCFFLAGCVAGGEFLEFFISDSTRAGRTVGRSRRIRSHCGGSNRAGSCGKYV